MLPFEPRNFWELCHRQAFFFRIPSPAPLLMWLSCCRLLWRLCHRLWDCTGSDTMPRDGLWHVELGGTGSLRDESTEFSCCDPAGVTTWPTDLMNPAQLCGEHLFIVLYGELASTRFCDSFSGPRQLPQFWHYFRRGRRWSFFRMLGAVFAPSAGVWASQECALRPVRQRCTSTEVSHSWLSHDAPS